jgi:RNA polymerase sigma-70 factor (ECF subfamily)
LSALRGLSQFDGRASLATWLHRIFVNAALMKLRSRKRRPERSIDDFLPRFLADEWEHQAIEPAAWIATAGDEAERGELCRQVRAAIDELPINYRTVLLLRDIEELDTDTTAALLGTSTAVVKTRLHRARRALRELLDPRMRGGS